MTPQAGDSLSIQALHSRLERPAHPDPPSAAERGAAERQSAPADPPELAFNDEATERGIAIQRRERIALRRGTMHCQIQLVSLCRTFKSWIINDAELACRPQ